MRPAALVLRAELGEVEPEVALAALLLEQEGPGRAGPAAPGRGQAADEIVPEIGAQAEDMVEHLRVHPHLACRRHALGMGDQHIGNALERFPKCRVDRAHAATCWSRRLAIRFLTERSATAEIVPVGLKPDDVTKTLPS